MKMWGSLNKKTANTLAKQSETFQSSIINDDNDRGWGDEENSQVEKPATCGWGSVNKSTPSWGWARPEQQNSPTVKQTESQPTPKSSSWGKPSSSLSIKPQRPVSEVASKINEPAVATRVEQESSTKTTSPKAVEMKPIVTPSITESVAPQSNPLIVDNSIGPAMLIVDNVIEKFDRIEELVSAKSLKNVLLIVDPERTDPTLLSAFLCLRGVNCSPVVGKNSFQNTTITPAVRIAASVNAAQDIGPTETIQLLINVDMVDSFAQLCERTALLAENSNMKTMILAEEDRQRTQNLITHLKRIGFPVPAELTAHF